MKMEKPESLAPAATGVELAMSEKAASPASSIASNETGSSMSSEQVSHTSAGGTPAQGSVETVSSTKEELLQNGHSSPVSNGSSSNNAAEACKGSSDMVQAYMVVSQPPAPLAQVAQPTQQQTNALPAHPTMTNGGKVSKSGSNTMAGRHPHHVHSSGTGMHVHRGHSPNNSGGSAASSSSGAHGDSPPPGTQNAPPQHVVHVHVNPGETFSVRVGDQIQHIQGPATVRMVSNNGPPLPMPMQVPPGHMVQQIVDEKGILTHVILSPQPHGMAVPPMTGGTSNGPQPQQLYHPYPTGPANYQPAYTNHSPHQYQAHTPHHPMAAQQVPPHLQNTPPPAAMHSSSSHPHINIQGHITHTQLTDDRKPNRGPKRRIQRRPENYQATPHRPEKLYNGALDVRRQRDPHSSSSSADGGELEEERRVLQQVLSSIKLPKVTEVEPKSALVELTPPDCNELDVDIDPGDFKYELHLGDKESDGKYKLVYSGDATEITLQDLCPATEYYLRVISKYEELKGDFTTAVTFLTPPCEPEAPAPPKLSKRTKTSLFLSWNSATDNGSKIIAYSLECDEGRLEKFTEVYTGTQKQFRLTKLTASTGYTLRLAAHNMVGKSQYSKAVCYYTSGTVPLQPDPPMISERFVKALTISWIKRPTDDSFNLQMEDENTDYGFLSVYNGTELSYRINNLRRNTDYRFRLFASNEEGKSQNSEVVTYRTLPDRPGAPQQPQLKGKVHATSFKVTWDNPRDTGGADITKYHLQLEDSRARLVYEGADCEYTCDGLFPGHTYRVRVACTSVGGTGEFSEALPVTTQAVAPGKCQPPRVIGKPKASSLHLKWASPDCDGGASVKEYYVQMSLPDNSSREVYCGSDTECMVAGLAPGRPYLFQVRASNKAGSGDWSDSMEAVSGAGVPDPPKAPLVQCKSPHCIVTQWDEPVNNGATITEYRLEWQAKAEGEFVQLYFGSALSYEVRNLLPATPYNFRVQALNSAGLGPFSAVTNIVTPPSSPSQVTGVKATATPDSITVVWREPSGNGSEVCSYNIDIGEKHQISTNNRELSYVIDDLLPETTYKIRVQAVNAIGTGTFSSSVKVTTRPLPPLPPRLECVTWTHNSLKLRWGDGKNFELIHYVLEMMRDAGSFYPIYRGPQQTHKLNRLNEMSEYKFRIYASNEAGDGPFSPVSTFRTAKAPPPALKPPKVEDITLDSCSVEWQPGCRTMGQDPIEYCLQLQKTTFPDHEYRQVYRGSETTFLLENLEDQSDYLVRVCAVRLCQDGLEEKFGPYSMGCSFRTEAHQHSKLARSSSRCSSKSETEESTPSSMSDQQKAMLIMLVFVLAAIFVAWITQYFLSVMDSGTTRPASSSFAESSSNSKLNVQPRL